MRQFARLQQLHGCLASFLHRLLLVLSCAFAAHPTLVQAQQSANFHADIPRYTEQAEAAGLVHEYTGPWEYFVGGGVATFDCNKDRMPDVFIAGGENASALFVNNSEAAGALSFVKNEQASTTIKKVIGAYPIDVDNDTWLDLIILRVGENQLLKGGPECQFSLANSRFNFDGGRAWSTAFAATFEKNRHFPTLAIGNYVDRTAPGSPWGTCDDNYLFRPNLAASDALKQVPVLTYEPAFALSPGFCALSMLFTDWNKNGSDALRVTNDRHYYRDGQEQMWRLDQGSFARAYTKADGWEPLIIWGMGIAEGDLNADGYPEYVLTSMGDTKIQSVDTVQASEEGRPAYEDIAFEIGATAHRPYTGEQSKPSTGWHAQLADVNNDSLLDLYIAKGNVERMEDFAQFDPDNLLLGNHDGHFVEQGHTAGIDLNTRGRGATLSDFNADGLLDLLVVNRSSAVSLFRHNGYQQSPLGGNWLGIELSQKGANPFAVGAKISIKTGNKTQTRTVQVGGGHASGSLGFIHVGLGVAERASVRVQWPDGQWSPAYRVFANNFAILSRESDHVSYWYPPVATTQ